MEISGVVKSGAGKGAFFTQVEWVVDQCKDKLGYKPYPGTLNVHIIDRDQSKLPEFVQDAEFELIPDDPGFCSARVVTVEVNGIPGAVILPCEDVCIHADNVIEVIASCGLKQELGLEDGSVVRVRRNPRRTSKEACRMDIYKEIYDFAASAGALEGYLYSRQMLQAGEIDDWVGNLVDQYRQLPEDVRKSFQGSLDRTLGRAVHSLIRILGETHGHVHALKSLIVGTMPASFQDFDAEKAEKSKK